MRGVTAQPHHHHHHHGGGSPNFKNSSGGGRPSKRGRPPLGATLVPTSRPAAHPHPHPHPPPTPPTPPTMSQQVVRLARADSSPWGFRLQGGKDFGQPLLIQKVNGGSLAEKAGLQVGDALIKVNNIDVSGMRHKEAQDTLVKAGNSFEVTVQRGPQVTWKPQVTAVGALPTPGAASPQNVTRTSLAKPRQPTTPIGSGHNISPRPFGGVQVNGGDATKNLVNKQYNTPVGIYSEETIAETLSAQAEVLAGGVLGVNFMKNEKTYDSQKSEVYKMVHEVEKEPKEPEPAPMSHTKYFSTISHAVGGRATSPRPLTPLARQLGTPELPQDKPYMPSPTPQAGASPQCTDCGKSIVGGRAPSGALTSSAAANVSSPAPTSPQPGTLGPLPFHAPRLGTSHVSIPRLGPQTPTSTPTGPKPFGAQPVAPPHAPSSMPFSVPQAAPASTLGSKPQSTDHGHTVVWPPPSQSESLLSFHPPSELFPGEVHQFAASDIYNENIVTLKSEDMEDPPINSVDYKQRMSLCSQEVCCLSDKKIEKSEVCSSIRESSQEPQRPPSPVPEKQIAKAVHTQMKNMKELKGIAEESGSSKVEKFVEKTAQGATIEKTRRTTVAESFHRTTKAGTQQMVSSVSKVYRSESPELLDVSTKPHEIRSLLPPASAVRPLTPTQVVVFPPDLPPEEVLPLSRSPSATPQPIPVRGREEILESEAKCQKMAYEIKESVDKKVQKQSEEKLYTKTEVQKIVREEIDKILSDKKEIAIENLPGPSQPGGTMASALTIAPERPFTPVRAAVAKPPVKLVYEVPKGPVSLPPETEPYFPPPHEKEAESLKTGRTIRAGCRSPMTEALTIAPDRPYSPLPPATRPLAPTTSTIPINTSAIFQPITDPKVPSLPHGKKPMSMLSALTVAPQVPFTVPGKTPIPTIQCESVNGLNSSIPVTGQGAFKPVQSSFIPKPAKTSDNGGTLTESRLTPKYFPTVTYVPQLKHDNITLVDRPVPTDTTTKDESQFSQATHESLTKMKISLSESSKSSTKVSSSSGLHCPNLLPYYQQNIGEIPVRNRSISPAPHPIKAPSIHPTPASPVTVKRSVKTAAQRVATAQKVSRLESRKAVFDQTSQLEKSKVESKQAAKKIIKDEASESKISGKKVTDAKQKSAYESYRTHLLPYYQQNIGEIPVRNRSISPVPHPIRAPMLPEPWPTRTTPSPIQRQRANLWTASRAAQYGASKTDSKMGYQQSHISRKAAFTTGKQVYKPAVTVQQSSMKELHKSMVKETFERSLSPCSWKAKVRTVQNLSPIEVRLPSPVPRSRTPKPINVTNNVTSANVIIKPSPKMSGLASTSSSSAHSTSKSSTTKSNVTSASHSSSQYAKAQSSAPAPRNPTSRPTNASSTTSAAKLSSSQITKASDVKSSSEHAKTVGVLPTNTSSLSVDKVVPLSEAQYTKTSNIISQSYASVPSYSSSSETSAVMSNGALTYSSSQSTKMSREAVSYSKSQVVKSHLAPESSPLPGVGGVSPSSSSGPNAGGGGARGTGTIAGSTAPRRGRGVLNTSLAPGARIAICAQCNNQIRGPFITALGKIWCPEHFLCVNAQCRRPLQDIGFVEESEGLYCEYCFEQYLAPNCSKCNSKIKGDCLNAIGKQFHPECFSCAYCGKMFGNNPFFLEDSLPYCENDWNELFTTKCFSCGFPIEAGDRWVEALNNNYHSQCFNCTMCKKNLEGQSFYAKGGRPFCKNHAR